MAMNLPSINQCIIPSLTERCVSHSAIYDPLPEDEELNCVSLEHDDFDALSNENRALRSQIRTLSRQLERKGQETQELNQLLQSQHLDTLNVTRLLEVEQAQSRISRQKVETLQGLLADHKVKYGHLQDKYDHELARNMWIIDSDHDEEPSHLQSPSHLHSELIPQIGGDHKSSEDIKMWEHKVSVLQQQLDAMQSRNVQLQHRNRLLSQQIEEIDGQRDSFKKQSVALELRVKQKESVISEMQRIRDEDTPQPPPRRAIITPSFGTNGITVNTFFPDDISCTEMDMEPPLISPTYSMSTHFEYSYAE